MMRVILLNSQSFPCPGSHYFHTRKFLLSFEAHGFQFIECRLDDDLRTMGLSDTDIVYMSDHGLLTEGFTRAQLEILSHVFESGTLPVLWAWQRHEDFLRENFGTKWLLTGEHYRSQLVLPSHRGAQLVASESSQYVPLSFASGLPAQPESCLERDRPLLASFIGAPYQPLINIMMKIRMGKRMRFRYTPPFVGEDTRLGFFKDAHVVLGWHSRANVSNGVVVERVFEALAYGCVVISDNPYAIEATDGNVLFSNSLRTTQELLKQLDSDRPLLQALQRKGWEWSQRKGTYASVSSAFLEKARDLGWG